MTTSSQPSPPPELADDATRSLRWAVYYLLIALAVGNMCGRLFAVNSINRVETERRFVQQRMRSVEKQLRKQGFEGERLQKELAERRPTIAAEEARQRPFLSSNDRSRWLAIRALVDEGTFELDSIYDRHVWNTIDMVQHPNREGQLRVYSSKPPLLITLVAAKYWLLQKATGWTLEKNPYSVGRTLLVCVNVLPLALMIYLVALLAERFGQTDWGRLLVVASAALGTMLTTFAVVLNNHIVGAVSAAVCLYAFVRIWFDSDHRLRWYLLCGFAAAFTAANELPALSLLALVGAALLWKNTSACLRGFVPAAAVVVVAFFATTYWAHDSLRPPYMHRSQDNPADNWYAFTYTVDGETRQSYWSNPKGIDIGEPSIGTYALHVLVGHHGVFSLTPVWLLSMAGLAIWLSRGSPLQKQLALGIAVLSLTCLVFYIGLRPQQDRNYGGMTSGFRWMFWFAPLWLVAMLPAADKIGKTAWGRACCAVLLGVSALSASYPTWNPWSKPWIENLLDWW